MTVASILKRKGNTIVSVAPSATVNEIAHVLTHKAIGAVIVEDTAGKMIGIVSERDVVRALAANGTGAVQMTAEQLMTRKVMTATRDTTVAQAMAIMREGHFRHLPVLEGEELLGILSIRDVMENRISIVEQEAEAMKNYMARSIYSGQA